MCKTIKLPCLLALVGVCVLLNSGCRNRGRLTPFNSTFNQPSAGGSTAVAPPPTYSLNIPGANQNNGSGTNQPVVRQATNTLPNNGALPNNNSNNSGNLNINLQRGWRAAGDSNFNSGASSSGGTADATSVLERNNPGVAPTRVAANNTGSTNRNAGSYQQQFGQNNGQNRNLAQNNPSNNGLSFTDSTNFRTTAVDERLDQSRLPVTDASRVRPPSNFNPLTTVGQFNTPYYAPNQQQLVQNNVRNQAFNNTRVQQPVNIQAGFNQANTVVGRFGQPNFAQPTTQPYSGLTTQNQVLAQSTVYADPRNEPNFQTGWRNPELTASRDSINR